MKIINFFKRILKEDNLEQIEQNKEISGREKLQKKLKYKIDIEVVKQKLIEKEIREEQIKSQIFVVLFKEGYLKKENIIDSIKEKHKNIVLDNVDIEAIIAIHDATQYEDLHGDKNIRETIDDNENNIVKLVNKLTENARKEAKKYNIEDASEFVSNDVNLLRKFSEEINQESKSDEIAE